MSIENTTKTIQQTPLIGLFIGQPGGIEAQEAAGQRQLCAAGVKAQLPSEGIKEVEPLGVKVIGPTPGDPIFCDVELPAGWSIKPTEHSMWSDLCDEQGRKRAGIFYKAAFYDRSAHIRICRRYNASYEVVGGYQADRKTAPVIGVITDWDGTRIFEIGPMTPAIPDRYWETSDAAAEEARAELKRRFPDYQNPLAYWDEAEAAA